MAAANPPDPRFTVLFITSAGFDPYRARAIGVDLSREDLFNVDVVHSNSMEAALQIMNEAAERREYDCIIWYGWRQP